MLKQIMDAADTLAGSKGGMLTLTLVMMMGLTWVMYNTWVRTNGRVDVLEQKVDECYNYNREVLLEALDKNTAAMNRVTNQLEKIAQ